MDRVRELAAAVHAYCADHANPAKASKWRRYFKEGYDAWGLLDKDDPIWNQQQQHWLADYQDIGTAGFLVAGEYLFGTGKYEEGALAIRFLATRRDEIDRQMLPGLEKWFAAGIGNWAHTDVLCGEILAPLLRSGKIPLRALAPWRRSPLKYQRRAVPVAMLGLVKPCPDPVPLLAFIRPLMLDPERVVHQGLGWLLREIWKEHPRPVEQFLTEWKDQAARLIFQYATEKMPAAARPRFRRAKT